MTTRTDLGRELEAALAEVLAHVRGEAVLPIRIVDNPAAKHIVALRKRMKLSRQKFADRLGLDVRAVQDWEQGRRVRDRAARVLLTVIDRDPEAVVRALGESTPAATTADVVCGFPATAGRGRALKPGGRALRPSSGPRPRTSAPRSRRTAPSSSSFREPPARREEGVATSGSPARLPTQAKGDRNEPESVIEMEWNE